MKKILEDIRVVDLTHVWFGPWSTKILAMLGAEVIKIEPTWGEFIRFAPPLFGDAGQHFISLNVGKKGMTLDLKNPKGKEVFLELVKKGDIVINNFMPGTMEKLGIGYDELKKVNSRIIYAQLSGFGSSGPYAVRPSFAPIGEAYAGFSRLNGDLVDPEGPPRPTTDAFGDLVPGTWAALCLLAAIRYRDKTGIGQWIDVSQIEVCTHMVSESINGYILTGELPYVTSKKNKTSVGGIIKTKDGYVYITAARGAQTDRLTKLLGVDHVDDEILKKWVAERTVAEVVDLLSKNDLPVAPCNQIYDTLKDPHLLARNAFVEFNDPRIKDKKLILPDFPAKFSETPGHITGPSPTLGQHNEEVLSGLLGYSKEQIAKLREERVIT